MIERFGRFSISAHIAIYLFAVICIAGSIAGAAHYLLIFANHAARMMTDERSHEPGFTARAQVLESSEDSWMESVRSGRCFGKGSHARGASPPPPSSWPAPRNLGISPPRPPSVQVPRSYSPGSGGAYRTLCVRLCDGYAWPISASTSSASFARDQQTCELSCSSRARLYVHRNPGELEEMTDLSGRPYTALPTAFHYRTTYDQSCKCRPHPWEPEALERHRVYALEAKSRKGDVKAAAELKRLNAKGASGVSEASFAFKGHKRARR